ncbi:MAG TPA: hypothetical protein VN153_11310 [Tahibacter sp.]|nr:hypothetical protein [Tahibacter sp.]
MKWPSYCYRMFDGIIGFVCTFGVVPFSVGGFALGVWAGERLWQRLGISMSVLTVYADMAFGLAGLLLGSYLAYLLVAWLYSATLDGRLARCKAIHGDEIRERIERADRAEPGWRYRDSRKSEAERSDEGRLTRSTSYRKRFSSECGHTTISMPGIVSGLPLPPSQRVFHSRPPCR